MTAQEDDEFTTAIGQMLLAWSFLRSAEKLLSIAPSSVLNHDILPIQFLAAHSMELMLKSYLMQKGWKSGKEPKTKKPKGVASLGHDLSGARKECFALGLKWKPKRHEVVHFDQLARHHMMRGHPTRYLYTNARAKGCEPSLSLVLPALRRLFDKIEHTVDRQRVKNIGPLTRRDPGPIWSKAPKDDRRLTRKRAAILIPVEVLEMK